MIRGANSKTIKDYTPYVGLGVVRPLIANPTNEQYEEITGKKPPYDLVYELATGNDNEQVMPVNILCEGTTTGTYDFVKFYISDKPQVSRTGSILFMNSTGNFAWGRSREELEANPKMDWFWEHPFEEASRGIRQLYTFLQVLICYDSRTKDGNWVQDMINADITANHIFNRMDVSGINKALAWANKQDFSLVVMYTIKESIKDGNIRYYQTIDAGNSARSTFYMSKKDLEHVVSDYVLKLVKRLDQSESDEGRTLCKGHYSCERVHPFVSEAPPQEVIEQQSVEDFAV